MPDEDDAGCSASHNSTAAHHAVKTASPRLLSFPGDEARQRSTVRGEISRHALRRLALDSNRLNDDKIARSAHDNRSTAR